MFEHLAASLNFHVKWFSKFSSFQFQMFDCLAKPTNKRTKQVKSNQMSYIMSKF